MECLLSIDPSNITTYNKFCDRLESEMLPYIVSHNEEGEAEVVAFIELKLPYMAIVEQRIEQ